MPDLDALHMLFAALSGLLGAVLTYLATRRKHQVSERRVYVEAVERITADLRREIDRINADRRALEARLDALLGEIDHLTRERDTARSERDALLHLIRTYTPVAESRVPSRGS